MTPHQDHEPLLVNRKDSRFHKAACFAPECLHLRAKTLGLSGIDALLNLRRVREETIRGRRVTGSRGRLAVR